MDTLLKTIPWHLSSQIPEGSRNPCALVKAVHACGLSNTNIEVHPIWCVTQPQHMRTTPFLFCRTHSPSRSPMVLSRRHLLQFARQNVSLTSNVFHTVRIRVLTFIPMFHAYPDVHWSRHPSTLDVLHVNDRLFSALPACGGRDAAFFASVDGWAMISHRLSDQPRMSALMSRMAHSTA